MPILGFSWIPEFPVSKHSRLLAAHHPLTKEARFYRFAAVETSVRPSSPAKLLFQTSCVLLQLSSFLFLFLLPVLLLSPVFDFLLSLPLVTLCSAVAGPLPSPLARPHTHISLLPCKSCLTRTGALSKGHSVKWKSVFAASVIFVLMCCLTKGLSCFALHLCLLSRLGY